MSNVTKPPSILSSKVGAYIALDCTAMASSEQHSILKKNHYASSFAQK